MDLKRFEDYKQEVILAYKKKKIESTLPRNLWDHTPANLKKECLAVFHTRYSDKDRETFRELFNKGNNAGEYLKMIEESNPDIFRPLNNFLKRQTQGGTHNRNIELLAWLIDFESRPHKYVSFDFREKPEIVLQPGEKKIIDEESTRHHDEPDDERSIEIIDISENIEFIADESEETNDTLKINNENFGVPRKFNKTILAFFAALVVLSGTFIFYKQEPQCMYWTKDHYQSVTCDQKIDGATIIALDNFRLAGLRKITNKALITRNDIGKVYYSKVNGVVEFYTSGGENPEDNHKRLLPMTEYMYNKYVLDKP